jgi:adhesin transport system outer membrane protein
MNFKPLFLLPLIAPTLSMALSLQESIEEVIDTNPEYTERVRNFNVVREELYIAKSGYKPSVNLNSTYGSESINAPTTNNEDKSYTRSEIDLTISQNLFRGFGDKYEIARQTARLSSAGYSILEKANAIALEMAEAYLNVERNKKLLAVALQNSDSHDRVYSQIKERTDSGLGSRSEFEQAGSRLALAHSNYMTQLNAYEDSLTNFEKVYGALPDMEDFEESALSVTVPESYDDAKELVETNNPTLLLHGYNFKAAQDNYAATKQNYLPVIDLEVKKGISENVSGIEGKNENLSGIVR